MVMGLVGFNVYNLTSWLGDDMSPAVLPVSIICAVLGTLVLAGFTRSFGIFTFVVNSLVLFAGAVSANLLLSGLSLSLDPGFEKPLVLALTGMAASSLLVLAVMARDRMGGG